MTADQTALSHDVLRRISNLIINEVRGMSRISLSVEVDRFGRYLLALHDVDGDGVPDFAVGARTASEAWRYGERVLVHSGASCNVLQVGRG
jgi:hypothetical protein